MKNINNITRNISMLLFIFGVSITLAFAQPTLYTTASGTYGGTRAIITYDGGSNSIDTVYKFSSYYDEPWGAMMQASNGKIYGSTKFGGANNNGRIFEFHPETNTVTTVHDFNGSDGKWPVGAMTEASNGKLYGMCIGSVAYVNGVVYEYDYVNDIFTVKTVFYESDGGLPFEPFVEAPNHKLYSITTTGGYNYQGALVEYDYINNIFTARHLFDDNSGWHEGGITMAGNGKFYGANIDNIFEYDYTTDTYTVKAPMASATGFDCRSDLVLAPNGKMYGIATAGGAYNNGTIFEYDYINDICIKKMDLSTATTGYGYFPSLFLASNGKMYGLTQGELFEYDYINNVFTKGNHLDLSTGNKPQLTNFMEQYSITVDTALGPLCLKYGLNVPFTVTGPFLPNNVFTAQLSDASGSFANPTNIGTLSGMGSGIIDAGIAPGTPAGTHYRIRVVSSAPVYIAADNGVDLTTVAGINWYPDADGDGYGTGFIGTGECTQPAGYANNNSDCNDGNAAIHPGITETCDNGVDDDCNNLVDDNCCMIPTGLTTTDISATGATLNWDEVAVAYRYKFQYKKSSESTWQSFSVYAPATSHPLTGLASSTKYKWKVRSICNGAKSVFSPFVKFTTLPAKESEYLNANAEIPSNLNIYPNPSQGNFTVAFNLGNDENGNAALQIFNAMGQLVYETTADVSNGMVDHEINATANLASGHYFVRMIFSEKVYMGKAEVLK